MISIVLIAVLAGALLWMALAWFVADQTRNAGYVDVFWTAGTGAAGLILSLLSFDEADDVGPRQILVAILVALWSARLGSHVLLRALQIRDEPRYAKLRRDWGRQARWRFFWLFQGQGVAMALLAIAVFLAARNPRPALDWRDWAGLAIAAVGIVGESVSDQQRRLFAEKPGNSGRICDVGLWAWSRHPNSFFQCLGWLAYPLIGIALWPAYPWGWGALIGPAVVFWMQFTSIIPLVEEHLVETRGQAFLDYKERVSAFVPLPPRKGRRSKTP